MNLYDIVLAIINAGLTIYLLSFFFSVFAPSKSGNTLTSIIMILATIFLSLILIFVSSFKFKIIGIIVISIMISFIYDMKWYNRLLLSILNYAICGAAEYFILTLVSVLFSVELIECYTNRFLVLEIFLSKTLVLLVTLILKIRKHKLFNSVANKKYYSIIIIPISSVTVFLLQYRFYIAESSLSNKLSWGDLICNSLLIITNIVTFNIIDGICNNAEKDARLAIVDILLETQEKQYKELYNHNQSILKIKHDHKKFLYGVLADLEIGKYSDIRECVNRELNTLNVPVIPANQNSIVYLLLKHKTEESKALGISLTCEYHELHKICVSTIDLAILLGNALDNAIEATRKLPSDVERTISVIIKAHKEQIIIIIENPIVNNVDVNNLQSTKKSGFHGFGILSMKNITSSYGGDVVFSTDNGVFQTHIFLRNGNE